MPPLCPALDDAVGNKSPEGGGQLAGRESHLYRIPLLLDERGLFALDEQRREHAADAEVAAVDQTQAREGVYQVRIPGYRHVVEDVVRRDASQFARLLLAWENTNLTRRAAPG